MPVYSNFGQFARQQGRNWLDATDANKVLRQAVVTLVPVMKNRIQQGGKNSAGGQIGQYGEKRIKRAFGVPKGFASKRRLKKVTGQEGYKELRQKLGLQTAYVDLTFSGGMMRSLKPGPTGPNSYGIGFISETEVGKAAENEKRYGRVFAPTDQENKLTLAEINRASQKLLSR